MSTSFNQAAGVHTRDKNLSSDVETEPLNWQILSRCLINLNPNGI